MQEGRVDGNLIHLKQQIHQQAIPADGIYTINT
ncbi:hypothetical protein OKW21_000962 [Catalinimonas alkaloidigena]|nr:hypothetical protein [Catalinimonas alkaloidigena]